MYAAARVSIASPSLGERRSLAWAAAITASVSRLRRWCLAAEAAAPWVGEDGPTAHPVRTAQAASPAITVLVAFIFSISFLVGAEPSSGAPPQVSFRALS